MKKFICVALFLLLFFYVSTVNAKEEVGYISEITGIYAESDNNLIYNGEYINSSLDKIIYNLSHDYSYDSLTLEKKELEEEILKYGDLTKSEYDRISLLMYYGYMYKDVSYDHSDKKWYGITQILIYETVNPNDKWHFKDNKEGLSISYDDEVKEIEYLVSNHYTAPSFSNTTHGVLLDKYSSLNDNNKVLSKYNVIEHSNNLEVNNNGRYLSIKPKANTYEEIILKLESNFGNIQLYTNSYNNLISRGDVPSLKTSLIIDARQRIVSFQKVDKDNGDTPQGDANFLGAIYEIYDVKGNLISKLSTNSSGNGILTLQYGKYYARETKAPNGYLLNEKKIYFDVVDDVKNLNILLEDEVIKANIIINKKKGYKNDLEPEVGVLFNVLDKDNNVVAVIETNENGVARIDNLPYGLYKIKQINGNEKYMIDDFTVNIDANKDYNYNFINYDSSKVIFDFFLEKKYLEDIVIKLYLNDNLINTFTNISDIYQVENLEVGNYDYIIENIPIGYNLDSSYGSFDVKSDGNIINIPLIFEKIRSNLEIFVLGEDDNILKKSFIGLYSLDGNLLFKEKTNEEGIIFINNLQFGNYYLKQLSVDDGYFLNDEIFNFVVDGSKKNIKMVIKNKKVKESEMLTEKNKNNNPKTFDSINNYFIICIFSIIILGISLFFLRKKV